MPNEASVSRETVPGLFVVNPQLVHVLDAYVKAKPEVDVLLITDGEQAIEVAVKHGKIALVTAMTPASRSFVRHALSQYQSAGKTVEAFDLITTELGPDLDKIH